MKKLALFLIILSSCSSTAILDTLHIKDEIQSLLDRQKAAWNKTDFEGFMEFYWKSDELTFQSGNSRLHGWDQLLSRYKKNYSGENRGKLEFTEIIIRVLSSDLAYVLGRWKVIQKDSTKEGLFTLIFKKLPKGWRIIHDHSS